MVVDHADGLHEGVADRAAHELESPASQRLAHGVGFRVARRKLGEHSQRFRRGSPPTNCQRNRLKLPSSSRSRR